MLNATTNESTRLQT